MRPLRALPPAGTRIPAPVLVRGLIGSLRSGDARERLAKRFGARYGVEQVWLLNSGRAVLTVLLQAMKEARPERTEVILPGYTCYSVAAAAVRVGLKVRPVDLGSDTLDYDRSTLTGIDTRNTLALVTSNLFGIPNDLPWLEAFCKERGIFMIDDAAQAMHAKIGGRWVGTFGDAGLFSLDKGKNVTTIEGGVLLLHNRKLEGPVRRIMQELPEPSTRSTTVLLLKLLLYWLFLRPWLYWLPQRLLALGRTPWEVEYPVSRYPTALCPVALELLDEVEALTETRRSRAEALGTHLTDQGVALVSHELGMEPVFLRFPWIEPSRRELDEGALVLSAEERRLGVAAFYPACLMDVAPVGTNLAPVTADTPNARRLAATLLTLPTHGWVTHVDIERLISWTRTRSIRFQRSTLSRATTTNEH